MFRFNIGVLLAMLIASTSYGYPQSRQTEGIALVDQLAEPSKESKQTTPNFQTTKLELVPNPASTQQQDDSDMFLEPDFESSTAANTSPVAYSTDETKPVDAVAGSQRFFPLFSVYNNGNPPLGHSRPVVYNQEGAYSHRPYSARQNLNFDNNFRGFDDAFDNKGHDSGRGSSASGLLGSGNFGVIRGGTFYNDNDDISEYAGSNHHIFNPYYQNGHGRPASYYVNPKPTKHEQFANFRDFADINTPSNSAYSQYVIVYANKNSTRNPEDLINLRNIFNPNNINERLEMLDRELVPIPEKKVKLSSSKQKLSLLLPEKKVWNKKKIEMKSSNMDSTKDLYEPLLALS